MGLKRDKKQNKPIQDSRSQPKNEKQSRSLMWHVYQSQPLSCEIHNNLASNELAKPNADKFNNKCAQWCVHIVQ